MNISNKNEDPATHIREKDIFKDTLIRYLGYTNEVGEAFRSLIHVRFVHLSYVIASGYVLADSLHKGIKVKKDVCIPKEKRVVKIISASGDTLIWQAMASVVIPGFTINRICAFSGMLLKRTTHLSAPVKKWTVTVIGLSCIPFIIKPIDRSVDSLMDATIRKFYPVNNV